MNKSPFKISFEPRAEEDRSINKSRSASNFERKRIEASLYKAYFQTSSRRGMKPSQISCGRGKEYHFESHAEEKKSYKVIKNSKPRTKEGQSINSSRIPNLVRKRKGILLQDRVQKKEVTRSPRTLGLVRKGIRVLIHENSKPRAKEERNIKVFKLLRISGRREFELQSSSENSKPCTKQGQSIRYHRYGKVKMSQVTHF